MFVLKCRDLWVPVIGSDGGLVVKPIPYNIQGFQCDLAAKYLLDNNIPLGALPDG